MAKLLQGWKNKDIPTKMVDLVKEITRWNVKSVKWFLLVMYDKIWIYRKQTFVVKNFSNVIYFNTPFYFSGAVII